MNISFNELVRGALEATDRGATVRRTALGRPYADHYTFAGVAGQPVIIFMSTSAFEPYLYLFGPTGVQIASGRGGVGGSARIPSGDGVLILPLTGIYIIEATSFDVYTQAVGQTLRPATGVYSVLLHGTAPAKPPAAPSELTASAITSQQVNLQWMDNSADWKVFEVISWDGAEWIVVRTVSAGTTAVTIADLTPETTYQFSVRAINANGTSDNAEPIEVTTDA